MKIRILIRMGHVSTGELIGIGVLIDKNTFKGGHLFERGCLSGGSLRAGHRAN